MPRKTQTSNEALSDTVDDSGLNLVLLRGILTSEPVARELPSGEVVVNLEVTTPTGLGRLSVPTVTEEVKSDLHTGDEVVVLGHVRRRFFRSGAGVQSRTEVVAEEIALATQAAKVRKIVASAIDYLGDTES